MALRNRWRRQQVDEPAARRDHAEEHPDDRPTGVGKTEIARRLAKLADAPFIKVEATKFTEVGYVGKDVDTIVRDLVDIAVKQEREADQAPSAWRQGRGRGRRPHPRRPAAAARRRASASGHAGAEPARTTRPPGDAQAPARGRAGRQGDRARAVARDAGDGDHGAAGHGGNGRAAQGPVPEDGAARPAKTAQAHEDQRGDDRC